LAQCGPFARRSIYWKKLMEGKEVNMSIDKMSLKALLLIVPVCGVAAGCSSNAATGAAGGAVAGAVVGGPVGAAVGGVAGATLGAALTPNETVRVRQVVVAQRRPSVRIREQVVVGYRVPETVMLYPVPPEAGLRTQYDYAVINRQHVLVDPGTRQVVTVLQ
jgi:hypothetical protein